MITCYVDGSCFPNPGPGGWAVIVTENDKEITRISGSHHQTTISRMELTAVIEGLKFKPDILYSDSLYSINTTIGRYRAKANKDLVNHAKSLLGSSKLLWIRGHSGNTWHDEADALAYRQLPISTVNELDLAFLNAIQE